MIDQLRTATWMEATEFFLVLNAVTLAGSVLLCWLLSRLFNARRIFDRPQPLCSLDLLAAFGSIFFNVCISVVGWRLWIGNWILLRPAGPLGNVIDCLMMLLFMDLGMYGLHRLVHDRRLFSLFHRFHHRHAATNPISLFVLHPVEILGFGLLMIAFLMCYSMSAEGLVAYLALNVLWGTLGHSGVEPFPSFIRRIPGIRWLGTSTFHAEHHERPQFNFGFYTLVWDKLFGTLDPEYEMLFQRHDVRVVTTHLDK